MWECKYCKSKFEPSGPRSDFCSPDCRRMNRNATRKSRAVARKPGPTGRYCDVCSEELGADLNPKRKRHPRCDPVARVRRARRSEEANVERAEAWSRASKANSAARAWNERFVRAINNCPHCEGCGEQFNIFSRRRVCGPCQKERAGEWRRAYDKGNQARRNAQARDRRDEATLQKEREWRARNPDKVREQGAQRSARRRAIMNNARHEPWSFESVWATFGGRCYLCLRLCDKEQRFSNNLLGATVDHIHPISRGGPDVYANLALCCRACNLFKSDKYLAGVDIEYLRNRYEE